MLYCFAHRSCLLPEVSLPRVILLRRDYSHPFRCGLSHYRSTATQTYSGDAPHVHIPVRAHCVCQHPHRRQHISEHMRNKGFRQEKTMKLQDLDPKLSDSGILRFDCPVCSAVGNSHGIRIPLAPAIDRHGQSWEHTGIFPESLTVNPSIDAGCWHGHIVNGEIVP